jgi:hypothetical protein
MTDVGIAPAPASSPAPAPSGPSAHEAVVNPNPVNTPQPVGPQAPPRPEGAPAPTGAEHRRESIAKAFERARVERKGPAEAKMGHNQPPEATPKERPQRSEPPLDLKKRPADQESARERGEHGHFAPRQQEKERSQQPQQQLPPYAPPLPQTAPYREPPPRMGEHARREWAAAPESVRGEVYRMHHEFSKAYRQYRGAYEAMQPILPYYQLAQQHGTTLDRALDNYTGMERKLRADPIGGLDVIVDNLNLRTADGQKLGLRDIAYYVATQSPDQHRAIQSQNVMTAHDHQLAQLQQQNAWLAQQMQRLVYEQRYRRTRRGVDRFAETHPRLDELGPIIVQELGRGFSLKQAYQRAELLKPSTQAPASQTRTRTAQNRTTDRSIHGAPSGPANGSMRRAGAPVGRRDAIANAFKQARGSL